MITICIIYHAYCTIDIHNMDSFEMELLKTTLNDIHEKAMNLKEKAKELKKAKRQGKLIDKLQVDHIRKKACQDLRMIYHYEIPTIRIKKITRIGKKGKPTMENGDMSHSGMDLV